MKVFGFFSRKPQQPAESVPLPPSPSASTANLSPSAKAQKNVQLRTPSPSVDSATPAAQPRSTSPATKLARLSVEDSTRQTSPTHRGSLTGISAVAPNPAFVPPEPNVPSLVAHIGAIPPKILHAYVLARLPSQPEEALPTLATFFAELAPPPKMHCVRCHKDFVEVENDDRSCLVPHDDESAEVERVGAAKRAAGVAGATFETLWGCCGKIVEGDGDQGPPDGWCYEGKHTTDFKRARFRADSTPQNDKLVSCLRLNCHGIRSQLPRGARATRKRPRSTNYKEASTDEDASEGGSDSGMDEIVGKTPASARKGRPAGKGKAKATAEDAEQMDVDEDRAGDTASVAGSASGTPRGRGRPPKSKAQGAAPTSVAKRRVRLTESKVVPGTDGEDDDAASVKSAPTGPTPKRRGRPPKSKPVISDSDREMEVDGAPKGTPAQRKEKAAPGSVKPRVRSLSRTRPGDASDASVSAKPRSRVRKTKEAGAKDKDAAAVEGEEKPKKRRKVDT